MTILELIQHLSMLPPHTEVVAELVDGALHPVKVSKLYNTYEMSGEKDAEFVVIELDLS